MHTPPDSEPLAPLPEEAGAERDRALDLALRELGYDGFRPGQREAIETLLDARRLLLVAPTGGGKSLCYQLPAMLLPGTTIVVSPLIALMRDQVEALEARGVSAAYLASTLDGDELARRTTQLARGELRMLYVAPERLAFAGFRSALRQLDCPLFAIDEAHCISEWGHDFRPEYLEIGQVLKDHPDARVLACTATATPVVRDEIVARLGLPADTPQRIRGFARPNLALRVREAESAADRRRSVDATLAEALGEPGAGRGCAIVYGPTRKSTETEAERLRGRGWHCQSYHAGLTAERRDEVHAAFASGELEVVVATNAFGMGIDRADVRAVVHLAPPSSIESYYQEVGRAGRDGADAVAQMLIGPGDLARRRALIELDAPDLGPDGGAENAAGRHRWNLFLELMRFAEGGSCRHDAVLRYFGDEEETLAGCGCCDVCVRLASGESVGAEWDPDEAALVVRKALSAVARIHGRYGLGAAVALLRGQDDPRLRGAGLDRTRTFGALGEYGERWLTRLLRRAVTAGWVDFVGGDRPVVILTEAGAEVMQGQRPARMLLPAPEGAQPSASASGAGERFVVRKRGRRGERSTAATEESLDEAALARFEALRAHRLELARVEGVPPYVVASDRTLRDVARLAPANESELLEAHGIGEAKLRKYGAGLLAVVRDLDGAPRGDAPD